MGGLAASETGKGAVLMVFCMSIIGLVDNFVVIIAEEAGLWQFHFVRALVICGTLFILSRIFGWRLRPKRWQGVALRSLFGALAMGIYFGALAMLPIAQVGAGMFTAPIFVLLFSVLLFGQSIGVWRVLAVGLGFAGAMLVLNPDPSSLNPWSFIPMGAGLSWALSALTTRHMCEGESTATLTFWFFSAMGLLGAVGLVGIGVVGEPDLPEAAAFLSQGWVTPTPTFMMWIFVQAFGSLLAIGCLTRAYQIGETSYIAIFEYSFLVFAGFWAWLLWGQTIGPLGLTGVGAIVLSGAVIALRTRDA